MKMFRRPFSRIIAHSLLLFFIFSIFHSTTPKAPSNVEKSDPFNSVIHPHLMEKRFADCFSTCGRLREPSKKYCFKNCIQG
uniref:Ovule protein n=1 Tax=Globodera pallida TaxID=36090 RepID=A0A183BY27_GLOPA